MLLNVPHYTGQPPYIGGAEGRTPDEVISYAGGFWLGRGAKGGPRELKSLLSCSGLWARRCMHT